MTHKIAVVGGTGPQGRGLAYRLAQSGHTVTIGSRDALRAAEKAEEIAAKIGTHAAISGTTNALAISGADVVLLAVPWDGHSDLVTSLASELSGKTVISCVNPLGFDKQGPYPLDVPEGSAAQQAASLLPASRVCAAFNHVSAPLLADPEVGRIDLDVLICTEDRDAAGIVAALAARIPGMRGIYAGRLRNAHQVEAFTANLIAINRRYRAHAGIRVTDV